jgi:hypothetical protein
MSYLCDSNSLRSIIDDIKEAVLVVLCSSINFKGSKSLLLLGYDPVGFKKATSLMSSVHAEDVGHLTLHVTALSYLFEPQVLQKGSPKACSEVLLCPNSIRVPCWGPTGLFSLFPVLLSLAGAGRTLSFSGCLLFHDYLLE